MIPVFMLLFSSTGIVVLIACANIANLLLARGIARSGEFAVRLSLGATRGQLISQLLVESMVLAVLGGVAGVFVGQALHGTIHSLFPGAGGTEPVGVDSTLLAFALGLSVVTALVFGILPAWHGTHVRVTTMAKTQAGVTSAGSAGILRSALVASQIALALALLVVAGLFARSLVNISRIDLGMQISNLTTFRVSPALNGYTPERSEALFQQIEDQAGCHSRRSLGEPIADSAAGGQRSPAQMSRFRVSTRPGCRYRCEYFRRSVLASSAPLASR